MFFSVPFITLAVSSVIFLLHNYMKKFLLVISLHCIVFLPLLPHLDYNCSSIKLFFSFIFITWRLITLQYCSGFCHTLTWISHGFTCIPQPDPPPTSLSTRSLWVFPVHQVRALVSCIQPGLVTCFALDNIHVLMLFSRNIPPLPSPTQTKSLFSTSVSLLLFCI